LGKRTGSEKAVSVVLSVKQETPKKCLAAHAGSLVMEATNEVTCDLCPEPKKKNTNKPFLKSYWHCNICEFDFC